MAVKKKTAPKSPVARTVSTPTSVKNPSSVAATTATPEAKAPTVRRKEMVERIVATTGKKPNEIKSVLDGVLAELGKALSAGESLNLFPLGKITVNRQKKFDDREIIVCKVRRKIENADTSPTFKTAAE